MQEKEGEKKEEEGSIFRPTALESYSGTRQFEQSFQPIRYQRWMVLASIAALILGALIWFFFGSIPIEAQGVGIVLNAEGLSNIESAFSGVVKSLSAHIGEQVKEGDLLATLYNPETETRLKTSKQTIKNLKKRLNILREQIDTEGIAEKNALQESIIAAKFKIDVLAKEIPTLQRDVRNKEELAGIGLFDSQTLQESKELLWSKQTNLEKTKANLSHLEFLLKKGYRQDEIAALNEQLLAARQEEKLLETQLQYENIFSPVSGTILEWFIQPNKYVSSGDMIARLEIRTDEATRKVIYGYLPLEIGRKVRLNAEVAIELKNVKSQEYGAMLGNIVKVAQYAVSPENLNRLINNPDLIDFFQQKHAAVLEVIIEPQRDPQTVSGYRWTSGKGPPIQLSSGTLCIFKGILEKERPYLYFLPTWWIRKMIYQTSDVDPSSLEGT